MTEKFDIAAVDNVWIQGHPDSSKGIYGILKDLYMKDVEGYCFEPRERRQPKIQKNAIMPAPRLEDVVDVALAFIAHPDDEVIGDGGTIARLVEAGKEVWLVQFTDGETAAKTKAGREEHRLERLYQAFEADKILGVHPRVSLHINAWDFNPWSAVNYGTELYEATMAFIRYIQPDLVLTHSRYDSEPAHHSINQIVASAVYKASRDSLCDDQGGKWETPFAWEFETQDGFKDLKVEPDILIHVSQEQFMKKMAAMAAHATEKERLKIDDNMKKRYEEWGKAEAYIRTERRGGDYLMPGEITPFLSI